MVSLSNTRLETPTKPEQPMIYMAGDLGKSACKFLYWVEGKPIRTLWLGSSIARGVNELLLRQFEVGGEFSETAWIRIGDEVTLVGNSASGFSPGLREAKVEIAPYQIAVALGIAAIELGISQYRATLSVALPLNEYNSRTQFEDRLKEMGQGVTVCGRSQQFEVKPTFYPEGTGLYLLRRHQHQPMTDRCVVVMLGHRNLSVLVFDGAKLNPKLSQTSDELGFWGCFQTDARAANIREADFPSLLRAVTTGNSIQIALTTAKMQDFSVPTNAVRQGLMDRVLPFLVATVVPLLSERSSEIVVGGGVGHCFRQELREFFGQFVGDRVTFADEFGSDLLSVAAETRFAVEDLARPIRIADVFGLAKTLGNRLDRSNG